LLKVAKLCEKIAYENQDKFYWQKMEKCYHDALDICYTTRQSCVTDYVQKLKKERGGKKEAQSGNSLFSSSLFQWSLSEEAGIHYSLSTSFRRMISEWKKLEVDSSKGIILLKHHLYSSATLYGLVGAKRNQAIALEALAGLITQSISSEELKVGIMFVQ
jgi:hypothetical protein